MPLRQALCVVISITVTVCHGDFQSLIQAARGSERRIKLLTVKRARLPPAPRRKHRCWELPRRCGVGRNGDAGFRISAGCRPGVARVSPGCRPHVGGSGGTGIAEGRMSVVVGVRAKGG